MQFLVGPDKKLLYAHTSILAARCVVFKEMFTRCLMSGNAGPNKATLLEGLESAGTRPEALTIIEERHTPEVFNAMLEFIYCNSLALNTQLVCCLSLF